MQEQKNNRCENDYNLELFIEALKEKDIFECGFEEEVQTILIFLLEQSDENGDHDL